MTEVTLGIVDAIFTSRKFICQTVSPKVPYPKKGTIVTTKCLLELNSSDIVTNHFNCSLS